jgi:hypothetical protein
MRRLACLRQAVVGLGLFLVAGPATPIPLEALAMPAAEKASWAAAQCTGTLVDSSNEYIGVEVGSDGRFTVVAFAPAPWDLLYGWPGMPWTSFSTIRVDGADYVYGYPAPTTWLSRRRTPRRRNELCTQTLCLRA